MALTSLTSLNSLTSPFAKVDAGILHDVFFECLLEIEMIVPKINLIIGHALPAALAVYAQGLFCRCPRLVQRMPKACSADAQGLFSGCPRLVQRMPIRRSVRDHAVGTNFFNFFNFPFAKVGLMIDYLNNVE